MYYCPKCGQQQTTDGMKFCPRCGFPLGGVADLLANDGIAQTPATHEVTLSPRQRGIRQGVILFVIGLILVPVIKLLIGPGPITEPPNVLLPIAALIFWGGGLLRILYAFIFQHHAPDKRREEPPARLRPTGNVTAKIGAAASTSVLTPAREDIHTTTEWQPEAATRRITPPHETAEQTTRLLSDETEKRAE